MSETRFVSGGFITFWSCSEMERYTLYDALSRFGYQDYTPEVRTNESALKSALKEWAKNKKAGDTELIVIPHKNPEANGFEVRALTKDFVQNSLNYHFSIVVDTTNASDLVVTGGSLDFDDRLEIVRLYQEAKKFVSGASIGTALVKLVGKVRGTSLRPNGAIYWISDEHQDQWRQLGEAIEACDPSQKTRVHRVSTVMDASGVRAVRDAIMYEVQEATAAIEAEIKSGDLGKRALENRIKASLDLRRKVTEYENLLNEPLEALREAVALAEQHAARAIATQEDDTTFGSVFDGALEALSS